jgi:hypothetical protein
MSQDALRKGAARSYKGQRGLIRARAPIMPKMMTKIVTIITFPLLVVIKTL